MKFRMGFNYDRRDEDNEVNLKTEAIHEKKSRYARPRSACTIFIGTREKKTVNQIILVSEMRQVGVLQVLAKLRKTLQRKYTVNVIRQLRDR